MDNFNYKKGLSRRKYLMSFGTAGLSASALLSDSAHAQTERIKFSEFNYKFRTYNPDEVIKVGMIGTDGHTSTILSDIPSMKNVELAAYSNKGNPNLKIPENVRIYKTYEEMLDKEKLDLIGVCLPYYQNAKASIAAANKKIHIITEKPVATTLEDMNALLAAVKKNRVRLTTILNMRMEPRFQAIYKVIGDGTIGEPILATAQKSYKFGNSRPDFYRVKETYGGTIPWAGIHALDYIHFITRHNYTQVLAFQGNKDHPDYPGFQDYAGVLLRMSNGGAAMVNIDYLRPETAPTHGDDRLRVIGSEGVLEIKDLGARVELITQTHEPYNIPLPEHKSFFADFVKELRGEGKHILSPEEQFEITRVALLAHQSAEQNMIIKL